MSWFGRLRRAATRWRDDGLDLLFPPRCEVCRAELAAAGHGRGPSACAACAAALCRDGGRCGSCGAPGDGAGCGVCRRGRPRWNGIVILGPYADELRTAVLRAKRPAGEGTAALLADLLASRHHDTLAAWAPDAVVPVPMHWVRRAARGTSAADVLARGVAARLGRPCRRLLRRARATTMQNRLPVAERRDNVNGAFRPRGRLVGLRILLVDDVTTTGATLAACAEVLAASGAAAVYAAAVARADAGDAGGA